MSLAESWSAYMALLGEKAPLTAASVRPSSSNADRQAAEAATTPWTLELREFFSLHDGQDVSDTEVGTVLPDLLLLSLDEVVSTYKSQLEQAHSIDDFGADWPARVLAQHAGETAHVFLPQYVPIAEHGSGDFLYVDSREGLLQGCIRSFGSDSADEGQLIYDSLADFIESVYCSVETGAEHSELTPAFRGGALDWDLDAPAEPALDATSGVTILRLPFTPTDFVPSQVTDDDLIDLDAVQLAVTDTARSLHPGSTIAGARSVYRKVPRQRGVSVTWWVTIEGEEVIFVSFATGVDNDVIVFEAPTGPYDIQVHG